jgi:putative glycosyltransferase (TIGR04372 family)
MGIPLEDWFVCLHVRETKNLKDSDNRDATIQNHFGGIKAITEKGGWVVRIGDSSMTPLPPMERVIDYPHTPYKSELMDMYLISQCRFFFGTNSGPSDVAMLFGKPMLLVNTHEWSANFPLRKGDLVLLKHTYSRSRDRFLSVSEILDEPFNCQIFGGRSEEYVKVENTQEEIRDVVEEFLNKPPDFVFSDLQKEFNQGRSKQIHRWLDEGEPFWNAAAKEDLVVEQYRIASRADSVSGTLGKKYLEENWHVDNLETASLRPQAG